MFVYFIFDGSFICRCLYIFRPSSAPRHSIYPLQLEEYTLIINDLYLQILHSASENKSLPMREIWLQKCVQCYVERERYLHQYSQGKFGYLYPLQGVEQWRGQLPRLEYHYRPLQVPQ